MLHIADKQGYAWVTPTEAYNLLGVSRNTVYERVKRGTLKDKYEGKKHLILIEESVIHDTKVTQRLQNLYTV